MFEKIQQKYIRSKFSPIFNQLPQLTNTVNTTDNPFSFFESLHRILDILAAASSYEHHPIFANSLPSHDLAKILQNIELTVNDFLNRFMHSYNLQLNTCSDKDQRCYFRKCLSNDLVTAFHSSSSTWSNPNYQGGQQIILYTANNYSHVKQLVQKMYNYDPFNFSSNSSVFSMESLFDKIDLMDGSTFEKWCAFLFRKMGFTNVSISGKSGDQGVDVMAEKDDVKYAIQCKCYSSDLGNEPVQEVFAGKGFYNCHLAAVITNRHFTKGGKELAASLGVFLWDRDWIEKQVCKYNIISKEELSEPSVSAAYYDALTPVSLDIALESGQCSVSLLQHRLQIGYARAARIVDELEEKGFISSFRGSMPRDIFITPSVWAFVKQKKPSES